MSTLPSSGAGFPAVAVDGSGGVTVVWYGTGQDGGALGVFGRRFDATGVPLGPQFQVNTTPVTPANLDARARVAVDPAGRALVVWSDGDPDAPQVFGRLYDASGVPTAATDHVIATDGGDRPAVGADGTGFLVAWGRKYLDDSVFTSEDAVLAARLDASGQPIGPSVQVNVTATLSTPVYTAVTYTGVGYAVAWNGDSGLRARRLDTAGMPLDPEIFVGPWTWPSIATDGAGTFIVVTIDVVNDDIVASRFDADGNPIGTPTTVNSLQTPNHSGWTVAMGTNGEAVVLWIVQTTDTYRVAGRRIDASNAPVGDEFVLAERELFTLLAPAAGWIEPDGFFAAWNRGLIGAKTSIEGLAWRSPAPVFGTALKLRDHLDPTKRKIVFKTRDSQIQTLPALGLEPDVDGLHVHVFNTQGTGDSACLALPAAGWTATGAAFKRRLKYKDSAFANGPCKVATLREGQLRITCIATTQPIPYSLDEPSQGSIGVVVTSGANRICTELGGQITRDEPLAFTARLGARPATCPTPPVPCP